MIDSLTKVWGIGVSTAMNLYASGINSIDQLRKNQHLLNANQKVKRFRNYEFMQLLTIDWSEIFGRVSAENSKRRG